MINQFSSYRLSKATFQVLYNHTYTYCTLCNAEECDYERGPHIINIPAGVTEWPFDVTIYDDDLFETDEDFMLVIDEDSLPDRINRGRPYSSTVTIANDEVRKYLV